jgi:hypothetical protein
VLVVFNILFWNERIHYQTLKLARKMKFCMPNRWHWFSLQESVLVPKQIQQLNLKTKHFHKKIQQYWLNSYEALMLKSLWLLLLFIHSAIYWLIPVLPNSLIDADIVNSPLLYHKSCSFIVSISDANLEKGPYSVVTKSLHKH